MSARTAAVASQEGFSFMLPHGFVESYRERTPEFGFPDAGGNALGEITFVRTYSRLKEDGGKETWAEVCARVINGMYSLQKDHALSNRLPWSEEQALASAKEAYDRMFTFKWLPPGRGLWMMGTQYVMGQRNSAALNNCSFVSTFDFDTSPSEPFTFLMEASMLGIGVGFDTRMTERAVRLHSPLDRTEIFVVPDSREGWVESVEKLLDSYFLAKQPTWKFDYSAIRPAGTPIRGFGGTASGPEPLIRLHTMLSAILSKRVGRCVDTELVVDIANLIGVCVVAGNVRRSALIALGRPEDDEFVHLKDPAWFPERNSYDKENPGWGWMSNNSVTATVGMDYSDIVPNIALNGEPGLIWLDLAREYGRLADPANNRDYRLAGFNPCAEQGLESYELCTLVECFLNRHESMEDFQRTLKFAYLYAKTVTLVPTHWSRTNSIMQRNRRIGTSISGIAEFADTRGLPELRRWMDEGYSTVQRWDRIYSEWLCVRESIKTTTVKPSGSVSILAGSTPGVHWAPGGRTFLRSIRFASDDPVVDAFREAGYLVEDDVVSLNTQVVYFPVRTSQKRSERDVTIWEKVNLAALAQRHWSDNAVSVTVSFDQGTEAHHLATVLHMYEGQLKTVSFLPSSNVTYPQMPYTSISEEEYDAYVGRLLKVDFSPIYTGVAGAVDAAGERYCTTDACELKVVPAAAEFEDEVGQAVSGS
jgi:adenosylcobalamin-dependent ribonucleoside-triphosphate reductase